MLTEFGPRIWIADGPTVTAAAGFHYPTRMVVMRLENGGLVLWSPTALTTELARSLEVLGTVRVLIAPNSLHHSFLGDWQQAYPHALVLGAPGLREKRPDLRVDAVFTDAPVAEFAGEIDHAVIWGNRITTEVVFFHCPSRTTIVTDLLQQLPQGWFSGWRALVARLDLMTGPEPQIPRKFRAAFTNRPAARKALAPVLAWPTENLIIAHGPPVRGSGRGVLQRGFGWLVR